MCKAFNNLLYRISYRRKRGKFQYDTFIQTTEIYARTDSKQKREALESAYVDIIPNDATGRSWEKDF
jgi:hypothetical protein